MNNLWEIFEGISEELLIESLLNLFKESLEVRNESLDDFSKKFLIKGLLLESLKNRLKKLAAISENIMSIIMMEYLKELLKQTLENS